MQQQNFNTTVDNMRKLYQDYVLQLVDNIQQQLNHCVELLHQQYAFYLDKMGHVETMNLQQSDAIANLSDAIKLERLKFEHFLEHQNVEIVIF